MSLIESGFLVETEVKRRARLIIFHLPEDDEIKRLSFDGLDRWRHRRMRLAQKNFSVHLNNEGLPDNGR